jgi:small subunit ribosomal protein YMR-31
VTYCEGAVESQEPHVHPQAPDNSLPSPSTDFKRYRANAQQHGPLARAMHSTSRTAEGGGSGSGDVVMDRDELPARFRRMVLTPAEMEAIDVYTAIA